MRDGTHILRLLDDALRGLQANRLGVAIFIDVEKKRLIQYGIMTSNIS